MLASAAKAYMRLSFLFNYTNPAPSDHRKPTENKPKHKENRAKKNNFRLVRFVVLSTNVTPIKTSPTNSKLSQNKRKTAKTSQKLTF